MRSKHLAVLTLVASSMTMCAPGPQPADDAGLRNDLGRLAGRRVFFGHQSVGANLLDGVRRLAEQQGAAVRLVEATDASALDAGTLAHAFVAENGDPERKLASFEQALDSGLGDAVDVALLKFCYVDFGPPTDTVSLFAKYQATLARLRARHPRLKFVHVTVPLTTVQGGMKGLLKRALGRTPAGVAENAKREEYSDLVRRAYAGKEAVFDLARLESTEPDGSPAAASDGSRMVPALAAAYTNDGGHLNPEAQVRLARGLLAALASVP